MSTVNTLNSLQVICLEHRLNEKDNEQIVRDLKTAVRHAYPQILLDMKHINSLDWQGVMLSMNAFSVIQQAGGRLALMKTQPTVRLFLDLTQVSTLLPVFDDEASALAWFTE